MNDEVKGILESLDKIAKAEYYPEDLLTYRECQLLLDYITNLQKENEELKDLKMRKDVVIDYIEKKEKNDDNWIGYELLIEPIRIKNILGGDE